MKRLVVGTDGVSEVLGSTSRSVDALLIILIVPSVSSAVTVFDNVLCFVPISSAGCSVLCGCVVIGEFGCDVVIKEVDVFSSSRLKRCCVDANGRVAVATRESQVA